jgi:sulfonate transport system substrate-binding protein
MKKDMKKFLSLILTATLLVSLATACGNPAADSGAAPTPAGESAAQTATNAQAAPETPAASDVQAELKTVRIGFPSAGGGWASGILGAASEYGYLDEYLAEVGYKPELNGFVGAAPAIHEALVAKELDLVIYAGFAGDLSKANGIDHTLLAVTSWGSNWALAASAASGVETLADLRGKSIAYQRGATPQMYFLRVLHEGGLTVDDVEPINTTIPEGIAGVTTGSIDACVYSNGQIQELIDDGTVRVLHRGFDADRSVYYEPSVYIARTDFYNENKDVAVAVQKALLKARDKGKEDPDAYYRLQAEKSGNSLETILATAEFDLDVAIPLSLDEQYITSLKSILDFLHENELTTGNVDFDTWVDDYVVIRAAEEYANEN